MSKMENSPNSPFIIRLDDDQALLTLKTAFNSLLQVIIKVSILVIEILLSPFVLTFRFWAYVIDVSKKIAKLYLSAFCTLLEVVPLSIEVIFRVWIIFLKFVFAIDTTENVNADLDETYKVLKKILKRLHIIPLTPKPATDLYNAINNIPIFGKGGLHFPNFLFEDTFTEANFQKGLVPIVIPTSADSSASSSSGTKTQTSAETSSPASDQTSTSGQTPTSAKTPTTSAQTPTSTQTPTTSGQTSTSAPTSAQTSTSGKTPTSAQSSTSAQTPTSAQTSTSAQAPTKVQKPTSGSIPVINEPKPETVKSKPAKSDDKSKVAHELSID